MKIQDTTATTVSNENTTASETTEATDPVAVDTAETAGPKADLSGKDRTAGKGGSGDLADLDKQDLDKQVSDYRLKAQVGHTIAMPNDELSGDTGVNVEASEEVDAAAADLDAGMARGRRLVLDAGRKAAGRPAKEKPNPLGERDIAGDVSNATGLLESLNYLGAIANDGVEILPSRVSFGAGMLGLGATVVGVYKGIGGAHQEAHEFNRSEGYQHGYSKGFAAGLYGEPSPRRGVKAADNSKKQTYDFAHNDGARAGYNDATRLSDEDKAAARMYIESKMADNNEDHLWGNTDVAGAYVKRGGDWNAEALP